MADSNLKLKLKEKIEAHRPRITKLNKEFGEVVIDKVNIGQCIGGARDIRSLVTDISYLTRRRASASAARPSPRPSRRCPSAGQRAALRRGLLWFLLTGEIPTPPRPSRSWRTGGPAPTSRSTSST